MLVYLDTAAIAALLGICSPDWHASGRPSGTTQSARIRLALLVRQRYKSSRSVGPARHHRHQFRRGKVEESDRHSESAAKFHVAGGKLVRLEFPRTEIQRFGDVAVTYSQYLYEAEVDGKRSVTAGRVTEIFVLRNGHWTNPGWHTDTEK